MDSQAVSGMGTAVINMESPIQYPDVWGRRDESSMEEIRTGESWAQWQLGAYSRSINSHDTVKNHAIYGEWISPLMPERNLSALQLLACGDWDQTDISDHARLGELFLFPQGAKDIADIKAITDALFYMKEYCWVGSSKQGGRQLSDVIDAVSDVLARRWQGESLSAKQVDSVVGTFLINPRYLSEEERCLAIADLRGSLGFALGVRIHRTLKKSDDAAAELGFLRAISEEESAVLKGFVKNSFLRQHWPLPNDVVGKLTPERLLTLATLTKEYNLEWALAAMDWDLAPRALKC